MFAACGTLQWAGNGFCRVIHCVAFFLFCGVGKPLISDAVIRAAIAKARAKVARVSESTPSPAMSAVEVARESERAVEVGSAADSEELEKGVERRCAAGDHVTIGLSLREEPKTSRR